MTDVLRLDGDVDEAVDRAAAALRSGKLVVAPTDTVYGLAVHPDWPDAQGMIYRAKGRDENKPIAFLVDGVSRLGQWGVNIHGRVGHMLERYWPGPLTVVVATQNGEEGFRMPAHDAMLQLLERAGGSLRVTSANRSGEAPARTVAAAVAMLGDSVAVALDDGELTSSEVSTVVRLEDDRIEVLREGAIPAAELEKV